MLWLVILHHIDSSNVQDEQRRLESGTTRIFLGVITGEISFITQGVEEDGNLHAPLDPYIAEKVLLLGEPYVDYPICPPLHMAFNYGLKQHLNAASHLTRYAVDVNDYALPRHPKSYFHRGYPPALLYGLGMGQQANSSQHAAFLQRFLRSHEHLFNLTKLEEWRTLTDNPPLLHLSIALGNFDGVYLLLTEMTKIATIESLDQFQMTALHVAVWYGSLQSIIFLLYNGISLQAADVAGHTAMHLAVLRGQPAVLALLCSPFLNQPSKPLSSRQQDFLQLLSQRNHAGRTAMDLLLLAPVNLPLLTSMVYFAGELGVTLEDLAMGSRGQLQQLEHLSAAGLLLEANHSSQLLDDDPRNMIDSLTALPSGSYFREHYYIPQRPLLVSNQANGMGIWAYLDSDAFLGRFGDLQLANNHSSTLRAYVAESEFNMSAVDASNATNAMVLLQGMLEDATGSCSAATDSTHDHQLCHPPAVAEVRITWATAQADYFTDFSPLSALSVCHDQADWTLSMAAVGAVGALTAAPARYSILLHGRLLWVLLRPGISSNTSLLAELEDALGVGMSNWETVDGHTWLSNALMKLWAHHLVVFAEQAIGEVLFIPHDWHSLAIPLADSISLSRTLCALEVSDMRIQPVGYALYGQEDPLRGYGFPRTLKDSNQHPGIKYTTKRKKPPMFEFPHIT